MLFDIPKNLNERQKKEYERTWYRLFSIILNSVKVILFLAAGLVVYGIFGPSIQQSIAQRPKPLTPEERAAHERKMEDEIADDKIENGIHLGTGLKVDTNWELVRSTCTACHSAGMITQSKATREGWKEMIRWMQETQGLWELGDNEAKILDYLAANYAPEESGRRPNLDIAAIEWYMLEL